MDNKTNTAEIAAKRRRTFWIVAGVIVLSAGVFLVTRKSITVEQPQTARAGAQTAPGLILATPEQLKQLRIEPVHEETMDLNLEATGKVGFNEDRLTPVLAPYPGRILEVF